MGNVEDEFLSIQNDLRNEFGRHMERVIKRAKTIDRGCAWREFKEDDFKHLLGQFMNDEGRCIPSACFAEQNGRDA